MTLLNLLIYLRMGIQERFSQTDRALEEVPTWPNVLLCPIYISNFLFSLQKSLTTNNLLKVSTTGADGSEALKSKLKF